MKRGPRHRDVPPVTAEAEVKRILEALEAFGAKSLPIINLLIDERFERVEGRALLFLVINGENRRFHLSDTISPDDARFVRCALTVLHVLDVTAFAAARTKDAINLSLSFERNSKIGRPIAFTEQMLSDLRSKAERERASWFREQVCGAILTSLLDDLVGLGSLD
jgi:hypothetical protein